MSIFVPLNGNIYNGNIGKKKDDTVHFFNDNVDFLHLNHGTSNAKSEHDTTHWHYIPPRNKSSTIGAFQDPFGTRFHQNLNVNNARGDPQKPSATPTVRPTPSGLNNSHPTSAPTWGEKVHAASDYLKRSLPNFSNEVNEWAMNLNAEIGAKYGGAVISGMTNGFVDQNTGEMLSRQFFQWVEEQRKLKEAREAQKQEAQKQETNKPPETAPPQPTPTQTAPAPGERSETKKVSIERPKEGSLYFNLASSYLGKLHKGPKNHKVKKSHKKKKKKHYHK